MKYLPRPFAAAAPLAAFALLFSPLASPAADETPPAEPAAAPTVTPTEAKSGMVENAVVKVFSTLRYPDLTRPWNKAAPRDVTGSGVVIEGKRILTNAHVVLYASQIQIQANQAGDKLSASVAWVAPGIDLALLKLDDESFFDSHPALPRAPTLPSVKDPVMVYGYPTGGTNLSITKGIVSRIDFAPYNYPTSGLRIQIDAAINPGNSGGPAVVGDQMIGLAFSKLTGGTEGIGYIIPNEEIDLFLKDVADGHYDGKPGVYDEFQSLENPALRACLKLPATVHGIVVRAPYSDAPGYPLKAWDVITKIGDTPIDDQGMVHPRPDLRLLFTYLVQKIAAQGKVPLTIMRDAKEQAVELPVEAERPRLLPFLQSAYPSYFIYGPLVFSNGTEEFVSMMTGQPQGRGALVERALSELGSPLITRRGDKPAFPGEQLVIIPSPFFPHRLVNGYSRPDGRVVESVNGVAIKNLDQLVEVLRDSRDEFITIKFAGHLAESLVFRREEAVKATDEILSDNGVRSQGSPDAMAVWNAKPAK